MSNLKQASLLKASGLCGIAGPFIVISLIFFAILRSPWFSWTKNALSDLGVHGVTALLFNSSLVIGGTLTIIFATGLRKILVKSTLGLVGSILLTLDAADLIAIGIFPETAGVIHLYVSVIFFALLPISLFFIGSSVILKASERSYGAFTILAGIFAAIVWALPRGGAAIPEILAALAASIWSIVSGIKILRQA